MCVFAAPREQAALVEKLVLPHWCCIPKIDHWWMWVKHQTIPSPIQKVPPPHLWFTLPQPLHCSALYLPLLAAGVRQGLGDAGAVGGWIGGGEGVFVGTSETAQAFLQVLLIYELSKMELFLLSPLVYRMLSHLKTVTPCWPSIEVFFTFLSVLFDGCFLLPRPASTD